MSIVTLRYYVENEEQVNELEKITERLEKASIYKDIKFRLKLGVSEYQKISEEIKNRISKTIRKLHECNVSVEIYQGFGIGHAYLKAIFDNFAERNETYQVQQSLFLIDGDQYDISDERVINAIRNIDKKIRAEARTIGLVLRDYVRLAVDDKDDELRRIEELWHLNVCPKIDISNPRNISISDIHPAYLKYGEIIPGLIGFNPNTEIFSKALSIINSDIQKADLTKFAGDPYLIMLLGILSKESGKRFYSEVVPTTRLTRGSRFNREVLTEKAKSLKNTFVGEAYKKSVEDEEFIEELKKYFKIENIEEAKTRILKGFE